MRFGCCPGLKSSSRRSLACVWLLAGLVIVAACTPQNPIQIENALPGTPQAVWDVVGAGDPTIQGFATEISVDNGETISFKVDTDASAYRLEIYRMGWYQGNGARLVTTLLPSATLPQTQPDCLTDSTGLIDCGNWAVSASWTVPATQVSGIYFARLVRTDTNGASHVFFVVRDDGRNAPVLFQTADTTWQAYNDYGGNSLYEGNPPVGRAYKVSYNRPFASRAVYDGEDWIMNAEYPMVRWLERQGYDVAYFTGVDADRYGAQILNRKIYLSNGHDEYWSGAQRANVEAALAAGVNLAFFSGNKIFWKTRFEPSIDGSATPHRTLVCYKETHANAVIDPASPVWTGTWRDPRFSPVADGGRPENALGGSIFQINGPYNGAITLTGAEGRMRLWRSTGLESVPLEDVVTLAPGSLGTEIDLDVDNGFRPPGLVGLSSTPITTSSLYLTDFGSTFGAGSGVHRITLHRHPTSGARVFSTGTYQWSWGLDASHDRSSMGSVTDVRMMQATVNLFADMGVAPGGLQPELVYSAPPADTHLPAAVITSPTEGASIEVASVVTVNGTASDLGGRVAGIEVSTDGGTTWHRATGRETWSYTFTANAAGSATLRARAVDDSANLGASSAPVTVTVGSGAPCVTDCTLWPSSAIPATPDNGPDAPAELGLRLRPTVDGFITGLRFYKSPANTGVHVGNLWASDGTPLATATFTEETASGWQQVAFPAPVAVTAGTTYVASYFAPDGHYANDEHYFASQGISNPPLEALATGVAGANGVYAYGASSLFPTQTFNATHYWVDVVFSETLPPQLVSIAVTPAGLSVVAGSSQQFVATGDYSDGSTQDLSAQVAWASTNVAAATIAAGGLATGVAPGPTTITATLGTVSGGTELTVTPPPLSVTTASLPDAGFGAAYDAGVSATGGVPPHTWAVASGALPPGLSLVAETGAVTGAATQSGAFGFVVVVTDATSVSATRPLSITVGAAPLVSLLVTPEAPTMNTGGTLAFTATGTYADASTQDLTASATWGSSNVAVVGIDAGGLATAQATGMAAITATLGAISDGTSVGVEPGPGLEVVTATLPDATVGESYAGTLLASGGSVPYAWAIASGLPPGLTVDAGTGAISGTPTSAGTYGFVVEVADATLASATRPLSISVAPSPLVSIAITPEAAAVEIGGLQAFTATGTFADTSTQDLTAQVVWASSQPGVATIDAAGLATTLGLGITTLSATLGPISDVSDLEVVPLPLEIPTAALPDGAFGQTYVASVSATGGVPPYAWSVPGGLPAGVTLDTNTGALTGTPTSSGAFDFVVEVTDAVLVTASRPLSIAVGPGALVSLLVTPEAPTMNTGGTLPFAATGTYADASTEDLSSAVTWGSSNGAIVTVDAGGLATALATGTGTISATLGTVSDGTPVSVEPGPGLEVVTSVLPDATVAAAYAATLAGSGGVPPYAWAVAAGLPPGLTVDTGTGGISGTPTAPGVYSFVVELTDAELATATRPLSITVAPAPLVSIAVTPAAPDVVVGAQQAFTATGTYADASTQDLSAQVTWASSEEGVATIDGDGLASTLSVGTTTIAATIGETSGGTVLTVTPTAPEITTSALPNGSYGVAYSATLAAAGGTPPYTWAVVSGLPPGLALNASTGEITGSPLAGGAYGFTVALSDATLQSAERTLGITIPAVENYSLWPETAAPTQADGGLDAPVELGVRFRSDQDGFITGLRFYKHPLNTGTHVGNLWTESGALLGTLTFTGETASGWQQANFGAPIPVTADTVYVASYFVPNGHYSADEFYFQGQGVDSPPLHAPESVFGARNGLFAYGPASTFPDQNYNGSNYWVDVVFTGDPPPPLVSIAVTPPSPTIETGGGTQQLLATGTYADASTLDISSQVTWEVGTPAVATVSATGLATALTPGGTTVTATLGTVSGGASLNVALGTLVVTTTALPSIVVGLPYSATLAASGGIPPYTWSIASGLPAGLALDPQTGGIAGVPTEIGSFPFTAEVGDASAQNAGVPLSITVDPVPVLTSIAVAPGAPTLDSGTSVALTATGTYSNATQQNLTALVTWSSSDGSVATVSPTGELTAWNPGTATLTATLGPVDGAAPVTVNAGVPGATGGPGGPILVVTHEGNPYSRYLAEILEAEGLQAWTTMDVANVSPATLAAYDVVVLGEFPLTAAQVAMLEAWVSAGGNLIAMRPDKQLATLLGLSDLAATLPNGYLRVETAAGPGAGIVGETIQYHGTSDVYALDGATQVAELYADATTATSSPAVTLHQPLLGRAAAFTYDLARSVVWSRQGNPAWSGQSRSGTNPIRPVELFFGNAPGDVQPDWVNLEKVAIPQADEQQRLLVNLILQMNLANRPLPRFWYLPSGHKAAVVMTGDDHANGGTAARFDAYANASVPGCSVADWECIRGTSYVYAGSLSPSQASFYESQGFEVSLHIDTGCANWFSPESLTSIYANQHVAFAAEYPGVPAPTTNRTHCIVWSDFDSQPQVELAHGVRLDTTYYYFPGAWVQDRPGFMTGSGMPMRYADRNGNRIDVYQAATQMTDESAQSYPATVDALLDGALGANGYYGVFTANMHTDFASAEGPGAQAWAGSNAIVASAQSRGVPVVTARQMLTWLDGRNASSFGGLAWDGNVLSFTVTAGPGATHLRALLPVDGGGVTLQTLTQGGNPVPFTTGTVKGVVYAMFPAMTGAYEATYQ